MRTTCTTGMSSREAAPRMNKLGVSQSVIPSSLAASFYALFYGGCATCHMKTLHGERISAECHCTNPLFLVMDELLQLEAMLCRFNDWVFWGSIQARESRWNCWNNSVHKQVVERPESSADNASDYEELVTNQTHFLNIILNISSGFPLQLLSISRGFHIWSGQCTHIYNRLATTLRLHSSSYHLRTSTPCKCVLPLQHSWKLLSSSPLNNEKWRASDQLSHDQQSGTYH